ncbi:similar to Saccharomyces cerevisiae YPL183C RTT10 Cytoplasmic protein with a role in regulation of Ty1 transposition [Maudiozyma saulgeensis]|uniref:Similar to Saccharomyces cerevisiae YPL183C RTT10 Cytoplasmic protein with a role in regulation of Ty1 transposition n=1 Tax=Maudiozyma saulgeensis TaxID=1789683 RepID=A0A1X7RA76_9SACH|nr:similar to Saccharomyces cerevisiae YPL183C RTT10 Cytoplasmic protein with a role in regulation of Ty1 transposition [Kazachstania saulgeensis]
MTGQLQDLSHYGPSLCVKFNKTYTDYIFVAVGPFIQIYRYDTGELINRLRIFKANKVHGFNFSNDGENCVLFGSKSISICSIRELLSSNDISSSENMYTEWIIDSTFSYDSKQLYILTCYNLVLVVDLQGNIVERKNLLNERSILYSGTIKVLSDERVIINAGTVLGGILIWDLYKEEKMHNLTGHDGSIFYVVVSNEGQYVASCSDDRSIRLWDLTSGRELSIGWGHTARIWNLKFFNNDTQLISVSEDCTCRVWNIIKNQDKVELVMANIYETHLIKNVWSVDVLETEGIAATSGNDGRIKLIDLKQTTRFGDEERCFNITSLPSKGELNLQKGEIFKGFHWFDFGLVAITSLGNVLKYSEREMIWELITSDERLASYSITNGVSDATHENNVIVFSNNKCDILMLNFSKDGQVVSCKNLLHIESLSKTCNSMVIAYGPEHCLVAVESPNPRDKFVVLQVKITTLEVVKRFNFLKPEGFVSSCLEVFENSLLIGSRFSTVAIFNLEDDSQKPYLIRRITSGDTTTSIKHVETINGQALFSVTNRDGFYNFIKIDTFALKNLSDDRNDSICLHGIIHSNKVIKGFLEGAFYNSKGDYITYGFKSSLFYMFNEKNGYEIASQVCGGAHRQWKLCSLGENVGFMLVYIKASELFLRKIYTSDIPETLEDAIHGREIRDISILPRRITDKYDPQNGYLFVTGSEDTTIKLCKYDPKDGAITNYWTERKHVSGLQRLSFINDKLMVSCSAREELFLWELNTEFKSNPYMTIRQSLPTLTTHPDLRIMDFDVLFNGSSNNFIISTVYSDSSIKMWYYNYDSNQYQKIWENRYQTCCILNTSFVQLEDQLFLLIAATDGFLSLYNLTNELSFIKNLNNSIELNEDQIKLVQSNKKPQLSLSVHKSGIKTMDVNVTSDNILQVFTGGDDNSIGMTIFKQSDDKKNNFNGKTTSMIENAASSTVTSCQLFNNATNLITTSVDQRVRVWIISSDNKLILKDTKYTTIADTGSCDVVADDDNSQSILLGGVGLSVWKY